ncbi:MAG: bleomycin resistance protein [Edaphobacter sp.]|nr:bleomycin resistance protein [Edaphobacter sp.]
MMRINDALELVVQACRRSVGAGLTVAVLSAGVLSAQTAPERPKILGLSHFAIFAHDFDRSRKFYGDFLGFDEVFPLKNPDGTPSMTFYKINDHQYIELFPEKTPNSDRLNHISFETDNIEALRLYLASKGVKVPSQLKPGRIGNLAFNITDPAGHTVEMVQYMPTGETMRNYGKHMSPNGVSKHMTHVGIIVSDLDPEYRFYTEVLGFKETWRGSSSGTVLSWINLKTPDSDDYVELMLSRPEPEPTKRGTAHHLCLVVPDVSSTVAKLKTSPYMKDYGKEIEVRTGKNRKRQANLFDPDGTRTEVMEPTTIDGKPTPPSTALPPQ